MGSSFQYTVRWQEQINNIDQSQWDALALPLQTPFLEWDWLNNLEQSGSVTPRRGWQPCHLTIWHHRTLVAAAPLYLKGHSYGEFVFDHQWAHVAYQLGINYYPKLLGMTPFTPAVGYRFLIAPDQDETVLTEVMLNAIDEFCQEQGIAGCHFLFVDPNWRLQLEQWGFRSWQHHSYIWENFGFSNFDDYLQQFNANQRRNIKRERKKVQKAELDIKVHSGDEIPYWMFPLIYRFYSNTCEQFFGISKYLTRNFFEQLSPNYAKRVVVFAAYEDDSNRPVGLSFCIRKGENLYGRYWGCFEEYDCLHFEACYYKPIEWAIEQGIQMFDPGAGGSHKRRRGFTAKPNYSLHRFYHPKMSQILHAYIDEINEMEQAEIDAINQDLPFKKQEITLDPNRV